MRRVLLICLEGAEPSILHPLIDAGALPNLARLIEQGASGKMRAFRPFVRAATWATVATGLPSPDHGIAGDLRVRPDGAGVGPIDRPLWTAPPFWARLADAGLRTALVNWPASGSAEDWPELAAMVGEGVAQPVGASIDAWPMAPGAVAPRALRTALRPLRLHPSDISPEAMLELVPDARAIDQDDDTRLAQLAFALARGTTVHSIATHIAAATEWDALAVVYPLLADVQRRFLRFREPRMADVEDDDVRFFGQVVDHAYRLQDAMLERLLKLAGEDVSVVLVSGYGFNAGDARPTAAHDKQLASSLAWRNADGFVALHGPAVAPDALLHGASILDVAPTVLSLCGVPADGLPGNALAGSRTGSPAVVAATGGNHPPVPHPNDLTPEQEAARRAALREWAINAAEAHLARGNHAEAARLYEEVVAEAPTDWTSMSRLARCHVALRDAPRATELAERLIEAEPELPWGHLLLGAARAIENRADAVDALLAARERGRGSLGASLRIATTLQQIGRLADAEGMFREVRAMAPAMAAAHDGLGSVLQAQGKHANAVAAFRAALSLDYWAPAVRLRLARSLSALGDAAGAKAERALALQQDASLSDQAEATSAT